MKMSEDERQCLSESRGGSANVISIFSYCARRYFAPLNFLRAHEACDQFRIAASPLLRHHKDHRSN